MSTHESKTWLVAYDIRTTKRRRRVHKLLRKNGLAAQYSAFSLEADDTDMAEVLAALESLIDTGADDVRAYRLPARCPVWLLGKQNWPDGVTLSPQQAVRLLVDIGESEEAAKTEDAESADEEQEIEP